MLKKYATLKILKGQLQFFSECSQLNTQTLAGQGLVKNVSDCSTKLDARLFLPSHSSVSVSQHEN